MTDAVYISEVCSDAEFLALRNEWNELIDRDERATIFQTWEYQYHGWRIFAGAVGLNLLLIRDETGALIGCAPLGTQVVRVGPVNVRVLGFACIKYSDYCDVLLRPELSGAALAALQKWLLSNLSRWDVVWLGPLREDSWLFTCRDQLLRDVELPVRVSPYGVAPYLRFQPDWTSYDQALSRSTASSTRNKVNKLFRRYDGRFDEVANGRFDKDIELFFDLHGRRMRDRYELSGAFPERRAQDGFRALVKELSAEGLVRFHTISAGQQAIGSLCTFEFRGTVSYFQSGFDPEYQHLSPGTLMHALRINGAMKDGASEYDLLTGAEPYKFSWANGQRRLYSIELMTGSRRQHLYHWWFETRDRLARWRVVRAIYGRYRAARGRQAA